MVRCGSPGLTIEDASFLLCAYEARPVKASQGSRSKSLVRLQSITGHRCVKPKSGL